MKTDMERLLEASLEISRLKREAQLAAEAINALSQENALLKAQIKAADSQLAWARRAVGRKDDNERYRADMKAAGRGHLLGG